MDITDRVGLAEDEQIVVAANFAVPGVETGAAIALLVELEPLDHGAHGAVEHQDALGSEAAQRLRGRRVLAFVAHHPTPRAFSATGTDAAEPAWSLVWLGRNPSRWQTA